MPALNVFSPGYNFLTGQPLRLRTSDGEVSWDQPGPLFDPDEAVATDAFNSPTAAAHRHRPPGRLSERALRTRRRPLPAGFCTGKPDGSLVVYNTTGHAGIPPDGTVVAVAASSTGCCTSWIRRVGGARADHRARGAGQRGGLLPGPGRHHGGSRGRCSPTSAGPAAEVLGKALFWDMQVGSDGVQSCGSCHFNAGADNRTEEPAQPEHPGHGRDQPARSRSLRSRVADDERRGGAQRLPLPQGTRRTTPRRRRQRRDVLDGRQPVQAVRRHPAHRPRELPRGR